MDLLAVESGNIDAETRMALRGLWDRSFGDRFSDDALARTAAAMPGERGLNELPTKSRQS